MESRIGPSFKKVKSKCYSDHKEGVYVLAKPNICDPKTVIKYIGRYLGHPVIAISRNKQHFHRSFNQWRTAILSSFGYGPLECPNCKHKMSFLELYYNHRRISLEELYEKAMSKSRGKRSSA